MATRVRHLLLLVLLLQDYALTTDADGDTEACSGQQTLAASEFQTDPLAGLEQKDTCSGQQTLDSSECQTDTLADTEQTNIWTDDGAGIGLNEILASAQAFAETVFKEYEESFDEEAFEEQTSIVWSNIMSPEEEEVLAKEEEGSTSFLFPPLERRTPKQTGDVLELDIGRGEKVKLIALSVNPPLFEIPNFLTKEECDYIITASKLKGTMESVTFTTMTEVEKGKNKGNARVSESALLDVEELGQLFADRLHTKVAKLIDMPVEVVRGSAPLTIGKYHKGGHYHAHLDSNEANAQTPCCFQKRCSSEPGMDFEFQDCCRICRYATVIHYLNDVEEGGETAFPLADLTWTQLSERDYDWRNLTTACHKAHVRVKPQKGKTLLWYNHFVDRKGYLGPVDSRSHHGGCDVLKGTKWIATNWISAPRFSQRRVTSKHLTGKYKDL